MSSTFQHTAARRRLIRQAFYGLPLKLFQHTAARRRLNMRPHHFSEWREVSTHSRPKAAEPAAGIQIFCLACFNTQPPEGG